MSLENAGRVLVLVAGGGLPGSINGTGLAQGELFGSPILVADLRPNRQC